MRIRAEEGVRAVVKDAARAPMLEGIERSIKAGTMEDKLRAIPALSAAIGRGHVSAEDAVPILCAALEDMSRQVRWSAVMALAQHGSKVLDGLRMGLRNGDQNVRAMCAAMIYTALLREPGLFGTGVAPDSRAGAIAGELFLSLPDANQSVRVYSLSSLRELAARSPVSVLDEMRRFRQDVLGDGRPELELGCRLEIISRTAIRTIEGSSSRYEA
ncbi:MAG: HEAT repeat domain-containing protein [Candidatus Micrarchaeota archaeon]